jgi:hypothetical protein
MAGVEGWSHADCDGNGTLNWIADFWQCFYPLWDDEDISADCNGDNEVDGDDIDCFTALFAGGCS